MINSTNTANLGATTTQTALSKETEIATQFKPVTGNKIIARLDDLGEIFKQNPGMRQACEHARNIISASPYSLTPQDTKEVSEAVNKLRLFSQNNELAQSCVSDIRQELQKFLI